MIDILISFLVFSILGVILHFTYNLTNKNIVVGIFSAVNESTWEHIKMLLTPIFLYNTLRYILKFQTNYFIMLLCELLVAITGIYLFQKIISKLFSNKYQFLNIISFFVTAFLCSLVGYIIQSIFIPDIVNMISVFGAIIIFVMYMTLSICPPKKEIFKDPVTNTYGITCVNN